MTLQQLDPSNEFASTAIPDIYMREEMTDKAKLNTRNCLRNIPQSRCMCRMVHS